MNIHVQFLLHAFTFNKRKIQIAVVFPMKKSQHYDKRIIYNAFIKIFYK